jgi:hypothetical protein
MRWWTIAVTEKAGDGRYAPKNEESAARGGPQCVSRAALRLAACKLSTPSAIVGSMLKKKLEMLAASSAT